MINTQDCNGQRLVLNENMFKNVFPDESKYIKAKLFYFRV